jgi:protein TonB
VHLVISGAVLVLGLAGACSAGAPDAPAARHQSAVRHESAVQGMAGAPDAPAVPHEPAAQRRAAERPVSTPPTTSQGDAGAKQIPGSGLLRYPDAMRAANREGEVYTMFVVDERGLVDTSSFRVVKSTDPAFTAAVRAALPTMRFTPARKAGRAVRQVVELPFTFALQRN